jgi:hypothetical protein
MMYSFALSILFLTAFAQGQTAGDRSQTQNPDRKILTAEDFEDVTIIRGSGREEETFWLQINKKLPPYQFRLIPDPTVNEPMGAYPHRVGRIEISTGTPPTLIQTIDVITRAWINVFTARFKAIDINLDSFLDIAVLDDYGAKWGRQKFWLFDKRSGRFITNSLTEELHRITHNGIETHPETKEIEVSHFPEATPRPAKVSETYKIVKGHLVLMRAEEIKSTSSGLKVFIRKRVRGKMRTIDTKDL